MRVHELAKELGLSSKECVSKLHTMGVEAKSHMSAIEDAAAELLREECAAKAPKAPTPSAPSRPPPAKEAKKDAPPAAPVSSPAKTPVPAAPPASKPTSPPPPATAPAPKPTPPSPTKPVIHVKGSMVVRELAEQLGIRPNALITELMSMNVLASIAQRVDMAILKRVAEKHGFVVEQDKRAVEHKAPVRKGMFEAEEEEDQPEDLVPRPAVVTFLGHVDHGKTSLLDRIRNTTVVDGEHGGITQHIGAYSVDLNGKRISFLDTPGHQAFTAMRARGANLTDIAVIVIAAEDGIMPQTREAIQHVKAAGVAMMVAINKIDLPSANVDQVMRQLQTEGLAPEEWGGDVICSPVSAQTGEGIEHLLEMILLQADVLDLRANPNRKAKGYVIEARLEPGMGPTANLLVTNGTLHVGDVILCGSRWGRVRALINEHGVKVKSAGPSTPVKCMGFSGVVGAGAEFRVMDNERVARDLAAKAEMQVVDEKRRQIGGPKKTSLEGLFAQIEGTRQLELKIILKADTQGSIEAITHALSDIKSDKISLNFILAATGNITDNDVMLASASDAVILGFHVGKEPGVDAACRREGVEVRLHHIIYHMLDEVQAAMQGMLAPLFKETVMGQAEIRKVFPIGKRSKIAGCMVTKGSAGAKHKVRVKRADEVLFEGAIESLRRYQDSVAEVREGQECGVQVSGFAAIQEGDILEFYIVEEMAQTL